MHVGIVCACLPAHRFLLGTIWPKIVKSTGGDSANNSNNTEAKASKTKSVYKSPSNFDTHSRSNFIPLDDVELGRAGSAHDRTPGSSVHTFER